MKPITSLLLVAFTILSFSYTPSIQAQTAEYTFTIHIGAFVKAELVDFNRIRPLGFLYAEKFQNNLKQVYLGEFTSEAAANQLLQQVKVKGYPDAYVTRRNLQQGEKQYVIQLGIAAVGENIVWQQYLKAGPLFALLNQTQIKIATGVFDEIEEANQRLDIVKRLGYTDAFVKSVNNVLLHPISTFEAGGELLLPEVNVVVAAPASNPAPEVIEVKPAEKPVVTPEKPKQEVAIQTPTPAASSTIEKPVVVPPAQEIPQSYDEVFTSRSPEVATVEKNQPLPLPTIRVNVKRTSAIELQKVLKEEGIYKGSLDGLYGKGTEAAYNQLMGSNRDIQKYQMLAKTADQWIEKSAPNTLESAISAMGDNPQKSIVTLEKSVSPLAKAYRAYYGFTTRGPQAKVDEWMNAAIKEAFKGQKANSTFDPTATYTYKDLNQLLFHMAQIHSVTQKDAAVPCWLFQRHPQEAAKAFAAVSTYRMERCDSFSQWESLKLLTTIAADLDPNPSASQNMVDSYASIRSGLFVAPIAPSAAELKAMENWNTALWKGLDEWTAQDPIHQKMTQPLKVAYYQSMVLLEDYYMDRSFKPLEAKGLALSVLQTLVAPYLEAYRK